MVPTARDRDQFTAVLLDPFTVALKVAEWPEDSDAEGGVTLIDTGTSVSCALAVVPGDAWLAAVTVTVCGTVIGDGAV
jgi:hypothetical protein